MPSNNYENTVGWLALKLRAAQLAKEQDQQRAIQMQGIQNTQNQFNQIPHIIQNQQALDLQRENNIRAHEAAAAANETKVHLAALTAAQKNEALNKSQEFRDHLTQLLEEGRNKRAANSQEGQNTRQEKNIASRESEGGKNRQNQANIAAGHDTVRLATATNPNTGNNQFPQIAATVGGGVNPNINPNNLPRTTYKELKDREIQLENASRRAKAIEDMLNSPDAREEDFGLYGTEFPSRIPIVGGSTVNSLKNLLSKATNDPSLDEGVKRRQRIQEQYSQYLVPTLMEIGGKTLTGTEIGAGLSQAGIDYDPENKKFLSNPFRNKLSVAREGMTNLRKALEKELAATRMQSQGTASNMIGTPQIETSNPADTIPTSPMPPPPGTHAPTKAEYDADIQAIKAKREKAIKQYNMTPEQIQKHTNQAAQFLKDTYGDMFNPADLQ